MKNVYASGNSGAVNDCGPPAQQRADFLSVRISQKQTTNANNQNCNNNLTIENIELIEISDYSKEKLKLKIVLIEKANFFYKKYFLIPK